MKMILIADFNGYVFIRLGWKSQIFPTKEAAYEAEANDKIEWFEDVSTN